MVAPAPAVVSLAVTVAVGRRLVMNRVGWMMTRTMTEAVVGVTMMEAAEASSRRSLSSRAHWTVTNNSVLPGHTVDRAQPPLTVLPNFLYWPQRRRSPAACAPSALLTTHHCLVSMSLPTA